MAFRIRLFATPFAVVAALMVLLNGVHAEAGIAVASFSLVAGVTGATLGYFADRLP
jgi:energy-converting hydrogenase Eha subunit A